MYPQGVIYQSNFGPHGQTNLHPSPLGKFFYQLAQGIGGGLIAFGIVFLIFTYAPVLREEILYATSNQPAFDTLTQVQASDLGVNSHFSVVIPKLGAASNIIANVSAADKQEYLAALQEGVAHAAGTHFPGQGEPIYLFSHSTDSPLNFARYNAQFYLLDKLEKGDEIIVFFADKKYVYQVTDKKVTSPKDTSWLKSKGQEVLILQTCYPPGTTLKRLLVLAKPTGE